MQIDQLEYLSKGKRGYVYRGVLDGVDVVLKVKNPSATVDTIDHEARMLQRLNKQGIGPRYLGRTREGFVQEFIDGPTLIEWLPQVSPAKGAKALVYLLDQCRTLDKLGISKMEMTRPYKHVLMRRDVPVQIDFDRAQRTERPKNVTQLCQWLTNSRFQEVFKDKFYLPVRVLRALAKEYKLAYGASTYSSIRNLLERSARVTKFQASVYEVLQSIPQGKVTTYAGVAVRCGCNSSRPIGQALKRNPCAPLLPCHRVVASDGTLGGFNGAREGPEIAKKIRRLAREGVQVKNGRIVEFEKRLWR